MRHAIILPVIAAALLAAAALPAAAQPLRGQAGAALATPVQWQGLQWQGPDAGRRGPEDMTEAERRQRRADWRDYRRQHDEARIQEAARREAMRIEEERAARRAWRRQQRAQEMDHGQGGYGYGDARDISGK